MRFSQLFPVVASLGALAAGQSPSLCVKYTTALFGADSPANEYALLVRLVNTVVIGNYTTPNVGIKVPGILAPATYNGHAINLLPYFDGSLKDVNNGSAIAVNFLADGGAAPLMMNMPSNNNGTAQYYLLTHLYQFFGTLLGCNTGSAAFPAYAGHVSMFQVHKYMSLSHPEIAYFNSQVELAALSFGVSKADAKAVFQTLMGAFNYKCLPAAEVIPGDGMQLQSICTHKSCPIDNSSPYSNCAAYPDGGVEPSPASA